MDIKEQKRKIAELEKDAWMNHVLSVLKGIHGDPLPDIIEKGIIEIKEMGNVPQQQVANWIGNLSYLGEAIEDHRATKAEVNLYWIRLHEVLDFIPKYFERYAAVGHYKNLLDLANQIKDAYTSEELIMIEYQRNCQAHVLQDGYRIRATYNKNKLTEDGLYRKGHNKVTLMQVIKDEMLLYGVNEAKMANAYFQKNKAKIDELWRTTRKEFQLD